MAHLTTRQIKQLIEIDNAGDGIREEVQQLIKRMTRGGVKNGLIHGLFTPAVEQIERVRVWNDKFGWGISNEMFVKTAKCIPTWPEERLVTVSLVPYLHATAWMKAYEYTFHALWALLELEQDARSNVRETGHEYLRLLFEGIEHRPGLRWEVIDLGCHRNEKPCDVRNVKESPHAGILVSALLHPEWVRNMGKGRAPETWIPGYEMMSPIDGSWLYLPYVQVERKRGLVLGSGSRVTSGRSVPKFVQQPIEIREAA